MEKKDLPQPDTNDTLETGTTLPGAPRPVDDNATFMDTAYDAQGNLARLERLPLPVSEDHSAQPVMVIEFIKNPDGSVGYKSADPYNMRGESAEAPREGAVVAEVRTKNRHRLSVILAAVAGGVLAFAAMNIAHCEERPVQEQSDAK